MADATKVVTREEFHRELNTERRITAIESLQKTVLWVSVPVSAIFVAIFVGFGVLLFDDVSDIRDTLTALTADVASLKTDVASLKTDVGTLQEGQARITAALLQAGIIE